MRHCAAKGCNYWDVRVVNGVVGDVDVVVVDSSEIELMETTDDQPSSSHIQQPRHQQSRTLTLQQDEDKGGW